MNKKYANQLLNTGGTNESTVYHRRRSTADFERKPQQVLSDHPRSEQRTEKYGYHTIAGKCPIQFFKQKFYGLEIGGESA